MSNTEKSKIEIPVSQKYLLTVQEAVAYATIGKTRIYELIRTGQLKAIKVGRYNKIHRLELEKFLDEAADKGVAL